MKRWFLIPLLLGLGLLLAACGGDGAVTLRFDGNDSFQFSPSSATVKSGAEVTVEMNNVGVLDHTWVLIGSDVEPATATEADAIAGTSAGTVGPGMTGTVTFTAPEAGSYRYICTIPGHAAAGMVGTLTVE